MITRREKFGAYAAWLAVCLFWGTTYLAIRIGLETLPPMLFAGLRFFAAGSVVVAFMRIWRGARLPCGRREWWNLSFIGLTLLGVGNGFVVWAEQSVPSGMAALLVATSPFWGAGLERIRANGERTGGRAIFGMIVGFTGLALLIAPQLFGTSLSKPYLLGVVALQIACASWSAGSVYSKHHPVALAPMMSAGIQMLVAGVALIFVGTLTGEWSSLHFSARSFAAFIYLILFGSIIAYGSYIYAIQKLPLTLVSTYSYVNPLIAVLLGWLILNEQVGWRVIGAACMILAGVVIVKTAPPPGRAAEETKQHEEGGLLTSAKPCSVATD